MEAIKEHFKRIKEKRNPGLIFQAVFYSELDEDSYLDSPTPNNKTNDVAYIVINRDEVYTAYTDLTERFPRQSSSGNEYLLIAYQYDENCIVAQPLKKRKRKNSISMDNSPQCFHSSWSRS